MKIINKTKDFLKLKILPWLTKNWLEIINLIVLFIMYSIIYEKPNMVWAEVIGGLWIFVLLVYYIFFKLFGFKLPKKKS